MELEDQCCSLELAKKLKDLGVEQKSIFVWEYYDDQCHGLKYIPYAVVPNIYNKFKLYAAYTVAELGEMVPTKVRKQGWIEFKKIRNSATKKYHYLCLYKEYAYHINEINYNCSAENEADARAKMLIYLLENNLITKKEIK